MSISLTLSPILTDQELIVYLASLELGADTVQHIAQKAELPRSTTYLLVEDLMHKGLLSVTKKDKKTLYLPEPPDKLGILLTQEQLKINQLLSQLKSQMPQLKAIEKLRENKPLISFYDGFQGVRTILEKTYTATEVMIICSGYQKPMDKKLKTYMFENYLPKTNELGIKTREIVTADPDLKRYLQEYGTDNHLIRVSKRMPACEHLDKLIFNNKVAVVDYDRLNGTVMEHDGIAQFERNLFEELWKSSEAVNG